MKTVENIKGLVHSKEERRKGDILPLVSVVIPVYNGERYIDESLQSVINQTYSNLEIIIVDDGSTDGACERALVHEASLLLVRQKNLGVGEARNNGIRHAKGDYIALLDVDDIWHSNKIEKQMAIFAKHRSVIAVGAARLEIDVNGKIIKKKISPYSGKPMNMRHLFLTKGPISGFSPSSIVLTKSAAMKCGLFVEDRSFLSEDYDFWIRLSEYGDFYILPEVLYRYRIRPDSMIRNDIYREYDSQINILQKYKSLLTKRQYRHRTLKIGVELMDDLLYLLKSGSSEKLNKLLRNFPMNMRVCWVLTKYLIIKYVLRKKFDR